MPILVEINYFPFTNRKKPHIRYFLKIIRKKIKLKIRNLLFLIKNTITFLNESNSIPHKRYWLRGVKPS